MTSRISVLKQIARALEEKGYAVNRDRALFAHAGIASWDPGKVSRLKFDSYEHEHVELFVYIYPIQDSMWQLRVTRHGGPHWTVDASAPEEAVEYAMLAMRANVKPPTGWMLAPEYRTDSSTGKHVIE